MLSLLFEISWEYLLFSCRYLLSTIQDILMRKGKQMGMTILPVQRDQTRPGQI